MKELDDCQLFTSEIDHLEMSCESLYLDSNEDEVGQEAEG